MKNTIAKAKPERWEAKQLGIAQYSTGRPCVNGHVAPRNTIDASCTECRRIQAELRRPANAEYMRSKRASMSDVEKDAHRAAQALQRREDRLLNPEKYRTRERRNGRLKRQRHPKRKLAEARARQMAVLKRTPPWADLHAIRLFYEACPAGFVVDHVIPIRGSIVSGLHVLENLQYLSKRANLLKQNLFDPRWVSAKGELHLPDWDEPERLAA